MYVMIQHKSTCEVLGEMSSDDKLTKDTLASSKTRLSPSCRDVAPYTLYWHPV